MSTFDSQVSKREIIETQIEHTRLSFLVLHQFWVKTIFPGTFIWNTMVPLLSYSCMFQVEICSQQLEICKSVYMFRGGNRNSKILAYPQGCIDLHNYCKCPIRIEIILPYHVLCSFCIFIIFNLLI
jgi:hypothetical protein